MSNQAAKELEYALVDVFAERALEGNMLAIFTDARGLSTEQMQRLARVMALPETTFIVPDGDAATEPGRGVRVRIFTTQEELPFAGHPTLGTAAWLHMNHPVLGGAKRITLELNAGPITVEFTPPGEGEQGVFGMMRQFDPTFGSLHDRARVAEVLNVPLTDLDPACAIETVSTGLPYCVVMLRSVEAMGRLAIPQQAAQAYLAGTDAKFFFCMAPAGPGSGADFHNRMQFYNGEDPATGSASGCGIAYLVRHGLVPSGRPTVFEQGVEIQLPSRIHVRASRVDVPVGKEKIPKREDAKISEVFVGGRTIAVAKGRFFLP